MPAHLPRNCIAPCRRAHMHVLIWERSAPHARTFMCWYESGSTAVACIYPSGAQLHCTTCAHMSVDKRAGITAIITRGLPLLWHAHLMRAHSYTLQQLHAHACMCVDYLRLYYRPLVNVHVCDACIPICCAHTAIATLARCLLCATSADARMQFCSQQS